MSSEAANNHGHVLRDGTLTRRAGNFTLAVIPIALLGTINLGLYVYSAVVGTASTVIRLLSSPFAWLWRKKEPRAADGYVRL